MSFLATFKIVSAENVPYPAVIKRMPKIELPYSASTRPAPNDTRNVASWTGRSQTPNPIELYEASVQQMLPIVAGVKTDQLSSPTPCSEWNVQALINHNLRVQAFVNTVLIGAQGDISQIFNVVDEPIPMEGAEAVYTANTDAVQATVKSMSMETVLETAFGPMPAGKFLMTPFGDLVVHKWDLAKATNQSTDIDSGLAEVCLNYLKGLFQVGRPGPEFLADEVKIPSDSSVQDQLLGIAGRQP